MNPDEIELVAANVRTIVERGGKRDDVLAYLSLEGFESREAWTEALESARTAPAPPERVESPPGTGHPVVESVFDAGALAANSTGLSTLGRLLLPEAAEGVVDNIDARARNVRGRNPGASAAIDFAAVAAALGVGGSALAGLRTGPTVVRLTPRFGGGRFAIPRAPRQLPGLLRPDLSDVIKVGAGAGAATAGRSLVDRLLGGG